ncbi:MAG: methyltransferase domain-containing protein [Acidobacteriota bacterium]
MYEVNRSFYDAPKVVDKYASTTTLQLPEQVILDRYGDELADTRFLEIGVGPGRTTPAIRGRVRQYVAIDYSAAMLAPCRKRFRDAQLVLCDGRQLAFPPQSFDAVYFCWNAIDDVAHDDRVAMLAEIARALRPGGLFFFSTHNREWTPKSPYTTFYSLRTYLLGIYNHLRHRKFERRNEEYAIVNESPGDFCTLTYFIDRRRQIAQLARYGFGEVEMVALDGRWIDAGEPCNDGWIYYVARRHA